MRVLSGIIVLLTLGLGADASGNDPFAASAALNTNAKGQVILTVSLSVPAGHYLYADRVKVHALRGAALALSGKADPKEKYDALTEKTVAVYDHDVVFTHTVEGVVGGRAEIEVAYQGCSETMCFLPVSRTFALSVFGGAADAVSIPGHGVAPAVSGGWRDRAGDFTAILAYGYMSPGAFLKFLDEAESGDKPKRDYLRSVFDRKGMWISIVLIILGGLALNLTPCVLPMVPINIAIIGAGVQAGSRRRGFALGGAYGAGMALAYGALGLVVLLTGNRFGALNSSPWFNIAVAVLFLAMALATFGAFSVDFSRFMGTVGTGGAGRGGYLPAFALGAVAALLAGACVAPVVISVLLLSSDLYGGGNPAGLLLPFLLGVGMGLPWPFAGAGLSFLPKPGAWMDVVKRVFGAIILLFALRYGYLGYTLFRDCCEEGRLAVVSAEAARMTEDWKTSLGEALTLAANESKPVLVDFWASWCKNCLKMEKTTFKDERVRRRLAPYVKVKIRAEDLNDPETKAMLDYFGAPGLPAYVALHPKSP